MKMQRSVLAGQIALVLALLVVWEICARAGLSDVRWFSSPSAIIARFGGECWHGSLLRDGAITLDEIALGFLTGTFGGILFGLMLGFMPRLRRILMPYLQAIYGVPRPAMAPIFVLWFGIGIVSKIVLIFSLVYFILVVYVLAGFRQINPDLIDLANTVGASRRQILLKVIVPSLLPSIFAGMKLGIGLAIVGAVVGEFIASQAGLGHFVLQASFSGDTVGIYAGLTGLALISLVLVAGMELLDRRFFGWQHELKL
jgi:ABC-type nitrate/sulfonate/bicarbonate transport system permease component